MKSRTSFFKPIALKKDISRFAPIWVLYLVGMMLVLFEMGSGGSDYDRFARNNLPGLVVAFSIVNLCYAGVCANLLFGDLYNTKLCYSLHAMPYRRESWLLTHLISGLLFSLVPNLVAAVYLMARLESYWYLGLAWLLAVTLQYLFFYGVATVSAMLTGNRFAMLAVYAGFNFVAMLLYATVNVLYIPMLNGVIANTEDFTRFSPTVQLFTYDYFKFTRIEAAGLDAYGNVRYFYRFDGLTDGWGYHAILAAVGLALMALSFWLYRKRHLESAGDFVAFPRLKGIACVIMTLCVALCFALVGEAFGSGYIIWLCVGTVVGYFGSLMLLERRIKVFRKGTLLGFAALAVAMALSVTAVAFDWFGIEGWTPKPSQVQSVTISNSRSDRYYSAITVTVEDESEIQQIIAAHEDILTRLEDNYSAFYSVKLTYKMKSGRTVARWYYAPATGEGYNTVRRYLYNTNSVLGFSDAAAAAESMTYMYYDGGKIPEAMYETVLRALQTDCTNGFVLPDGYSGEYYVEYCFEDADGNTIHRYLNIHSGAEEIGKLLKGPELAMGYTDWKEFLTNVTDLHVYESDIWVEKTDYEALLTALRKDIEAGTVDPGTYLSDAPIVCYMVADANGKTEYREFYIPKEAEHVNAWLAAQMET